MITITLLWNNVIICKLTSYSSQIREEIIKKTREKFSEENRAPKYCFTKFSRNVNKYMSTDLKNVVDGDRINVIVESSENSKENEFVSTMNIISKGDDSNYRKQLLEKLLVNNFLNSLEKKYIYNFLKFHENCSTGSANMENCSTNGTIAISKKRAFKDVSGSSKKKKKKKTVDSETQYCLPLVNDYESVKKYLRDYDILQPEDQNQNNFNILSKTLYAERRAYIMASAPTARVFKELHPYMFNYKQVTKEFHFITERENIYLTFKDNVKKYCSSILELVSPTPNRRMIKNKIAQEVDDERKDWIKMTGSLLLLPKYMHEDRKRILLCNNETPIQKNIYPYIYYDGDTNSCLEENASFKIFIEGVELCTADNLLDAFFGLLSTYYMFNAVYPPKCAFSFALFEQLYLEYTDQSEGPSAKAQERIDFLEKHCHRLVPPC